MTKQKVILGNCPADMVRVIQEGDQIKVFMKMDNGKFAMQRPIAADQRGIVEAITLALDVLVGKIRLTGEVDLTETAPEKDTIIALPVTGKRQITSN